MYDANVWGSVAEWVSALATVAAVLFAVIGYNAYRDHVDYDHKRAVAVKALASLFRLRSLIRAYRRPWKSAGEIEESRRRIAAKEGMNWNLVAWEAGVRGVYSMRWELVVAAIDALEVDLSPVEAEWGQQVAGAVRDPMMRLIADLNAAAVELIAFPRQSETDSIERRRELEGVVMDRSSGTTPDEFELQLQAAVLRGVDVLNACKENRTVQLTIASHVPA
jgi:hypothetical protein